MADKIGHTEQNSGRAVNWQAESLLALVKEHKTTCNNSNCGVSLIMLYPLYRQLAGEGTIKEIQHFV